MLLFYIYAAIAGAGVLSLPSYGAWWSANHAYKCGSYGGGPVVKLGDEEYNHRSTGPIDWWEVNYAGDKKIDMWDFDMTPYPVFLFLAMIAWPATITIAALMATYAFGSKLLALPGKYIVNRKLSSGKKEVAEKDEFLIEGERVVEKLLNPH